MSVRSTAWTSPSDSCVAAEPWCDVVAGPCRSTWRTAEALPFADNSFDAVLHVGGINFFNDKARAIAEMVRVAKPGAHVVIVDEKERAAKAYERTLPGFKTSFATQRPAVSAPIEAVPPGMGNVLVSDLWRGWFYCLEFDKPHPSVDTDRADILRATSII